MKNAFAIVTLSVLLSACATIAQPPDQTGVSPDGISPAESAQSSDSSVPDPNEVLPSVPLTPEILFKILSSEIAYQRGQWESAYITLSSLAQQTRDPRLAHRAVEIALSQKQGVEALAAVRLWRELAPQSEEATQYYLSFMVVNDKIDEAQPVFEAQLRDAATPKRGVLMFQIQRVLAHAKDKVAAFVSLEKLLAPYPAMAESHIALALGALGNGDNVRAEQESRAALALQPESELAALTLAQSTSDQETASKQLAAFLLAHPKAREVRLAYARMLAEQKKYAQARAEFLILLKTQPDDLNVLYALGILSAQSEDMKSAELYFNDYLKQLEDHPGDGRDPTQILLILAQFSEERGDSEMAIKFLEKIDPSEKNSPLYLGTQIKRALLIGKRGDLVAARKLLQELHPQEQAQQIQVILADAQLLRDSGQINEAFNLLDASLKRFPSDTDLLYDYAMAAEKLDRLDVMEKALRELMVLAPDNQHAYNALGYSLADRGLRLDEAKALIEKALKLTPDDPFILDSLAWVEFRLNHLTEAEAILRRTYAMRPDPEIAVHLGEVLWVKGEQRDARKIWSEAEKKDPKNATLKSTLTRLKVKL